MPRPETVHRPAVLSWALYDFANSPFTTLVVTFIYAAYFTSSIAPDEIAGTVLWSRAVTATALLVAFLSPMLGALADRGGYRKPFLLATTGICIGATAALFFPLPGQVVEALTWFIVANVAFELGMVFYNAFLPDIAPPEKIGRISGYGWALGYVGGLAALVLALVTLVEPRALVIDQGSLAFPPAETPWFGFTTAEGQNFRATNLLVAAWFAVFSLPIFLLVPEDRSRISAPGKVLAETWLQLRNTLGEIRRYRQIVRLLLARLLYNDGLVTVFAFGGIYARGTFGFEIPDILVFGIVLNVTSGLGALVMGFTDDSLGGKRTLQITLVGLVAATLMAALAPNRAWFWASGILLGIFVGPNQSASRSLMGRFVPDDKENEFFGFFAFSGKLTAFVGPFFYGVLTEAFDTQRAGLAVVLVLFVAGMALLGWVDEEEGKRVAREAVGLEG